MISRSLKRETIDGLVTDAAEFQKCVETFCIDAKFGGRRERRTEHPNDVVLNGKGSVSRNVLKTREEPKITIEMNIIEILASDAFRAKATVSEKVLYLKDTFFDPLQLRVIPKSGADDTIEPLPHQIFVFGHLRIGQTSFFRRGHDVFSFHHSHQ
jgi:hypothetical protein